MKYRYSKGYKPIFKPDHKNAMSGKNWSGWLYEHVYIATLDLGRPLRSDEEVHHLDGDKQNNHVSNLIVLTKSGHTKLHRWLNDCALNLKKLRKQRMNSEKPKLVYYIRCKKPLLKNKKFCNAACQTINMRTNSSSKLDIYSLNDVLCIIKKHGSILSASKYLDISGNGLRKWLKTRHNITNKAILSEALSTLKERAETIGEVQPS